jgi:hypothetical protein
MSYLLNAPELKLLINGQVVGYATGLQYRSTQGQKVIYGVDSPLAQEIAQGAAPSIVEGSMVVLRPKGSSPESWGLVTPRTTDENGVFETGENQSNLAGKYAQTALGSGRYSTLELLDRVTGGVILRIFNVMFDSQSWSVSARGIMQGTVSFQGMTLLHSSETGGSNSFF